MTQEDFNNIFRKMCALFQRDPEKYWSVRREYYDSRLGKILAQDFSEIIRILKNKGIAPNFSGLPQLRQLLEIYDQDVLPARRYKERRRRKTPPECSICGGTGYAPIMNIDTGYESVCGCSCEKGRELIQRLKGRKRGSVPAPIHLADLYHLPADRYMLLAQESEAVENTAIPF